MESRKWNEEILNGERIKLCGCVLKVASNASIYPQFLGLAGEKFFQVIYSLVYFCTAGPALVMSKHKESMWSKAKKAAAGPRAPYFHIYGEAIWFDINNRTPQLFHILFSTWMRVRRFLHTIRTF